VKLYALHICLNKISIFKNSMLFAYPRLSNNSFALDLGVIRLFYGPGLGNLMFSWARAVVAARKYNMKLLYPSWFQLHIGPIIRNESDKRIYHDLFRPTDDYLTGVNKLIKLITFDKISELDFINGDYNYERNNVVIFTGMKEGFKVNDCIDKLLISDYDYVFNELNKITLNRHKNGLLFNFKDSISVHIRFGDFSLPPNELTLVENPRSYRIPLQWYIKQINKIKSYISHDMPVYIFSDASDKELDPILSQPNVRRLSFGSSIADLLALSRSNILIASGSTFSQWASYFGRMPIIWHKGHLSSKLCFVDY
jgi:hypothetical protein